MEYNFFENKVYPKITLDMLRLDIIDKARALALEYDESHPWKNLSNEELLKNAGLWMQDELTKEFGYTQLCVLLFGTNEAILSICPDHEVIFLKMSDDKVDRFSIRTNLVNTYYEMLNHIFTHLNEFKPSDNQKQVISRGFLFHEVVTNVLMHHNYADDLGITILIEDNRFVFINASCTQNATQISLDNTKSNIWNLKTAEVFRNIGFSECKGLGMKRIYEHSLIYSGYEPKLTEDKTFITVVPIG